MSAGGPTPGVGANGEVQVGRYARVALAVPVDRTFHYRVPEAWTTPVVRGDRVSVRFRGRAMTGTVVGLDAVPDVPKVLDLLSVAEPDTRLPETVLDLCDWVARRYGASLGEALDAAVPPPVRRGGRPRQVIVVHLTEEAPPFASLEERFAKQARALRILREADGVMAEQELCRAAQITRAPIQTMAKKGWLERRRVEVDDDPFGVTPRVRGEKPRLVPEQSEAVDALRSAARAKTHARFLLYGVTGSGKTEVYLRVLEDVVAAGRTGIALVPEISLTPQTVSRFRARFERVAVLHSGLTEAQRMRQWKRIHRGDIDVVVGARSAVFAPLPRLGLIVVDEEHEPSFKQQNPPRYHARDVALERGRREGAVVILGSATPSLETLHACRERELRLLRLRARVGGGALPRTRIVDLGTLPFRRPPRYLSEPLRRELRRCLERKEQAILFLNRRGFARIGMCPACREPLRCGDCDTSLVYHRVAQRWICHLCGHEQKTPRVCPACKEPGLEDLGFGTERIEDELRREHKRVRVRRMDADTTVKRGSHEEILGAFGRGEFDVLLGTQMIAKGLDFPNVTLVGIISADTSLSLPDFRARERTYQLVSQVAGRAGRSSAGGTVIVQTLQPDDPSILAAVQNHGEPFLLEELREREAAHYPPVWDLVRVMISDPDEEKVLRVGEQVREWLAPQLAAWRAELLGPAPCPVARVRGRIRHHLLLRRPRKIEPSLEEVIVALRAKLPSLRGARVTLDVDPASLM